MTSNYKIKLPVKFTAARATDVSGALKRAEVTAAKKNVLCDVTNTPAPGTANKDKKVLSGHHNSQVAKVRASPHSNKKASVNVKGNNGVLNSITPMATIDDRTQLNKCRL